MDSPVEEGSCTTQQKSRSGGPHKSKLEKTASKKKSGLKIENCRSVSTYLPEESRSVQTYGFIESRIGEETMTRQPLFSMDADI